MSRWRNALAVSSMLVLGTAGARASHPKDFAAAVPPCLIQGDLSSAEKAFLRDSQSSGRNQLLYLYEMANLYHLKGDFTRSARLFDQADQVAHRYEGKALASVPGGLGQAGAALSNDTVLTWEGSCCDKVMARTINALNYLARKDLEGARVEVRKAEEYQAMERERIQKAVAEAGQKDAAQGPSLDSPRVAGKYGPMFSFVKDVRNSYENAFTYYLSSQIYRLRGPEGLDDALVDIRKAYELAPDSPAVQAAYLDLEAQDDNPAALEALRSKLRVAPGWKPADPARTGTVVVLFESGFAPALSEVSIDLLLPGGKLFPMAFPIYNHLGQPQPCLRIQAPLGAESTSKVADLRPLVVKSLEERMPGILARGTLGAIAKVEVQKEAGKQFGFFGLVAAGITSKVLTGADLRSWLSLPAEIQATQFNLEPGPNQLTLSAYDWSQEVSVDVVPGGTTFLTVRSVPGYKMITATSLTSDSQPSS